MSARRLTVPVVLCLLLACTFALTPGAVVPTHAQTTPALDVTLYDNSVAFHTVPFTAVSAELSDAHGTKDQGVGVSGADGIAQVTFFVSGSVIRPGDTVTLSQQGTKPLRVVVPNLAAAVDVATDRVWGTAPAGASVQVSLSTLGTNPTTLQRSVTADAGGTFTLNLAGELDLQAGAVTGSVAFTTADNDRFSTQFAALSASLTLGARTLRGRATAGTTVAADLHHSDGSSQHLGPTDVTAGGAYVLFFGGPNQPPLAAGDTVDISQTGGLAGSDQSATAHLVAVTVNLNAATDQVSGTGPASTALALSADAMDGSTANFTVTTDAAGAYALAVGSQIDLGPGWRVRASYEATPGVRVGSLAVLRKVRVGVHLANSQGRAEPGHIVTVTLRSSAGDIKVQRPTVVNDQGEYSLFGGGFFGPGGGATTAEPGDSVEIAFVDGDPQLLQVPPLSAHTDPAADTVSGDAPAGSAIRVRVDSATGAPSVSTKADAAGSYVAQLGGTVDLVRPSNGSVSTTERDGTEFYTTWAVAQLTINVGNTFGTNFVIGNGPAGRSVTAKLYTPDNRLVGQASGTVFDGGGVILISAGGVNATQFFLNLTDIAGTPIEMKPGDTLKMTSGDDAFELQIPPLDAVIFVQTDTINGHSLPGAKVTMQIAPDPTGGFTAQADATADGAGNFSHSFAGTWDIRYGDFVQLSTVIGGHTVLNSTIAPGLLLDMDQALLLGSLAPETQVTVALKRAGHDLTVTTTSTDASGAFAAALTDAQGEPLVLLPNDVIVVTPKDATIDPLTLTLPELTIEANATSGVISGRATAGGSLTMLATDAYVRSGSLGIAQAWPAVGTDSSYTTDFVPHVAVRPGTRVFALYRPPSGHYVVRSHTVPILNAEHSGPNACGFGDVRQPVTDNLQDAAGKSLATASTTARFDGFFSTVLRDSGKAALATAAGQTERAQLGAAVGDITMPNLDLQVDWQRRFVLGTGPANTAFFVQNAVPCPQQQPSGVLNINIGFAFEGQTGPDGAIQYFLPPQVGAPGTGLEVALYAPSDHRVFRHVYRALAQIYIGTDRVSGQANPLDAITLVLKGHDGTERGRVQVKADDTGHFDGHVQDSAGKGVTIAAGDIVVLQAPAEAPEITVEPLAFDWSPGGSPVVGQAPAGRTVQVMLRLGDGQIVTVPRQADAGGTFRFGPTDVPPRATWSLSDAIAVRVVLDTANGHQIIAQTDKYEDVATPVDHRMVYLPIAYGGHHAVAVTNAAPAAIDPATVHPRVDSAVESVRIHVLDAHAARQKWFEWLAPSARLGRPDDIRARLNPPVRVPGADQG